MVNELMMGREALKKTGFLKDYELKVDGHCRCCGRPIYEGETRWNFGSDDAFLVCEGCVIDRREDSE